MKIKENCYPIIIFAFGALVGPLVNFIILPVFGNMASKFGGIWKSLESLFSNLVFLLWPTQMLAVIEVFSGKSIAILTAIAGNIILFSVFGVLLAFCFRNRKAFFIVCYLLYFLIVFFALWGAGFDLYFLNILSLIIAIAFYTVIIMTAWNQWGQPKPTLA